MHGDCQGMCSYRVYMPILLLDLRNLSHILRVNLPDILFPMTLILVSLRLPPLTSPHEVSLERQCRYCSSTHDGI